MPPFVFENLRVIDCATVIAAPVAAMMLADFGADVIKIEQPGSGDMLRAIRDVPHENEATADYMWQMDGRNKRGLVLDLKSEEGIDILRKLVAGCDVFITNHPYSVRDSLGLTYESLKPLKPNMIYASLTAYGEQGPERARKGFDQLAYWARSGLMDLMRGPGAKPVQGLSGMGDHPTGVALYAGIVTALLQREKTGEGGMVHTSLLANGLWSNAAISQGVMAGGDASRWREGREAPSAMMRVYECSDGRSLQLNMIRDAALIGKLFAAIELPEDDRFSTPRDILRNRVALGELLEERLAQRGAEEWMAVFESYDLPVNLVGVIEEKAQDEQILVNSIATVPEDPEMGVPLLVNHPVKATSLPQVAAKRPPRLGEHGKEILSELGYSENEITTLSAKGVI